MAPKKEVKTKTAYSVKFDSNSANVIEELRKKPTGGLYVRNSIITDLVESNPKFIAMLKKINSKKRK
jgi:hypothetical protein